MIGVYLFVSLFSTFNFEQLNQRLSRNIQEVQANEDHTEEVVSSLNEPSLVKEANNENIAKELAFNSLLEIHFTRLPSLHVGDPVLFKGIQVGAVYRIGHADKDTKPVDNKSETQAKNTTVGIKLSSEEVPLNERLVGLVGSVKLSESKKINSSKSASQNFLELIKVEGGSHYKHTNFLPGYNSFQEFWSSKTPVKPVS